MKERAAPAAIPNFVSPPRKQASQELTQRRRRLSNRRGSSPLPSCAPAPENCCSPALATLLFPEGYSDSHLRSLPFACPPSERKGEAGEQLPLPRAPYFRAPTAFCSAVTTDENPGPLEESLLLPIPSSLSMNTQRHPRSRSSHSGGSRSSRATSGSGSHCSGGAGHPAPLPLAFPQPPIDRPLSPDPCSQTGSALWMDRTSKSSKRPASPELNIRDLWGSAREPPRDSPQSPGFEPEAPAVQHPPLPNQAPSPALRRQSAHRVPLSRSQAAPGRRAGAKSRVAGGPGG